MLQETPLAFLETYADAQALTDAQWQERARLGTRNSSPTMVAVDQHDILVGTMRGVLVEARPRLESVYVKPAWRGRDGVADALLDDVVRWAAEYSGTLSLFVHEANPRAAAFYLRRGFHLTGKSTPYHFAPFGNEIEIAISLGLQAEPKQRAQ